MTGPGRPPLLRGEALKHAGRRLVAELRTKIEGAQGGVPTFADHALLGLLGRLERLDRELPWEVSVAQVHRSLEDVRLGLERLQGFLTRRSQGRLVDFRARVSGADGVHGRSDLSAADLHASQGAFDCLHWKGLPLFKTAWDFALYPMILWELRPATIIELGSGTGASAVWLADVAMALGIDTHVYSVDLRAPAVTRAGVSFVTGDCARIEAVFDGTLLRTAPHPWLVIEDAHVNVEGVLRHFDPFLVAGDYLVVEDSAGKQDVLDRFLTEMAGCYAVDTRYTDFFGRNVTCAQDSILVRG